MKSLIRRISLIIALLFAVVFIGITGFMLIEDLSLIDSAYMTLITISTVGFGLVEPLSNEGKVFVIFLIIGGVSLVAFGVTSILQITLQNLFEDYFMRRRRMRKLISKLSGHYVIAGYGRVGKQLATEFEKASKDFVVIESNTEETKELLDKGILFIEGDATQDEVLEKTGLEKAKGLIAALNMDSDNVFITLSAKGVNKNLIVIARANTPHSQNKLKAAGANRVISPYLIGARRMAALLLQPVVSDYLDLVMHGEGIEFKLEELEIQDKSSLNNKSIQDSHIRKNTGALVLAIKREEDLNTNPQPEYVLKPKDKAVVIGTAGQLENLHKHI